MDLFTLSAKLQLDKTEYDKGLADSESTSAKFGQGLTKTLGGAAKIGAAGMAAISAATIGATTAIVNGAGKVAEYGDNIDKMSQKMGISAQAYQEWDAIMQHSGTSIDSMSRGMQTLQKNAVNSAEKFEALGITQEQLANMSTEDLFSATITGLQNMGEGAERTALASELLGGSAKELGALLNTSAEDTEAMRQKVHELGGVMSDEAVKAAAAYQDSLQDMQTGFESLKRNLLADFMPSITSVMDGLTDIFSGNYDEGLDKLSDGITKVVDEISSKLPKIMEVGGRIIETLAIALVDNLPTLFEAGMNLVMQLGEAIINNLPKLVEVALTLIKTFAQGLIDSLPVIIPQVTQLILDLVKMFSDPANLESFIDAAVQIIMAIANGLIEALPVLIPAVIDVILTIVEKLTEPDMLIMLIEASIQIMIAIMQGLIQAIPRVIEAVVTLIGNIVTTLLMAIPTISEGAWEMFGGLLKGLLKAIPELLAQIPILILNLINALAKGTAQMLKMGVKWVTNLKDGIKSLDPIQWGKDLIQNFIDGLKAKWEDLKKTCSDIAGSIKDFLGFSEPKLGPLSNFHTYAPDMMDLFMQGINDNKNKLLDTVQDAFDFQSLITAPIAGFNNDNVVYNNGMVYNGNSDIYSMLATIVEALPQLANSQIVLDTGILVGQTAPKMNTALGQIYSKEQRSV